MSAQATFAIFGISPPSIFSPETTAAALEAAGALEEAELGLVVDAYSTTAPALGKRLKTITGEYLAAVQKGEGERARSAQRRIAEVIRATDARKWLSIVASLQGASSQGQARFEKTAAARARVETALKKETPAEPHPQEKFFMEFEAWVSGLVKGVEDLPKNDFKGLEQIIVEVGAWCFENLPKLEDPVVRAKVNKTIGTLEFHLDLMAEKKEPWKEGIANLRTRK